MKILILYNVWARHKRVHFPAFLTALAERGAEVETRTLPRGFKLAKILAE